MGDSIPNRGPSVVATCAILIFLSTVFVSGRFYVRFLVLKNVGLDDWVALVSLGLLVALSSIGIVMVHHGTGRHLVDIPESDQIKFFKLAPTGQILYFAGSFTTRLSILLFLRRLLNSYKHLWAGIIFQIVYFFSYFLAYVLQCQPIKALWNRKIAAKCASPTGEALIMYTHGAVGVALDIALLVVPLILLWRRLMFRKMKFRMLSTFSVGIFACVAGIARLVTITTIDMTVDTTWNIMRGAIWTNMEVHVGLMVSCFPAIHPIFRLVRKKITGQSTTKECKYPKNTPYTGGKNRWGRSTHGAMDARGREEMALYSVHTKLGSRDRGDENDSQEAIVKQSSSGIGIYKSTDIDVSVNERSEAADSITAPPVESESSR